ncbi:MAG: alkaline phosphatase family protein [Candidatus Marsarchaeota archaeon]|nr:alkaline phosphatase family protein [Candidatus Marsarchaeota archaeon]MCL5115002.1 alkaline phosphatase family protein [Candidatus Marsarchaeota archaeon]
MGRISKKLQENELVIPEFKKSNFQVMSDIANGKNSELTGDRENKILMLIDGFGFNLLRELQSRSMKAKGILANASLDMITTVFPSVTLCVMSSLFSGMLPSEHGVIGDIQPVGRFGLMNIMNFSELFGDKKVTGVDYDMIYPTNYNLHKIQAAKGIGIFPQSIQQFPIGKRIMSDLHGVEYSTIKDLHNVMDGIIREGDHGNILVYYGDLDHTEHMHGYMSEESISVAAEVMELLGNLYASARNNGYNIVVTADHGHVIVKDSEFKEFGSSDKLAMLLKRPPWGNARTMFFESKEGEEEKVEEVFNEEFGDYGTIFKSEEMLAEGIFGRANPQKEKRENFGTHIVISKGNYSINYAEGGQYEPWFDRLKGQVGTHGGMSADEMQIPLIIF